MRKAPPKKQKGQATGPRELRGEILGVRELASLLGSSEDFVRKRAGRAQIPFRRLGGRLIFLRAEVLRFLEGLEGVSATEALDNLHRGRRAPDPHA